jgi:putative DNA primase/helicase
MRADKTLGSFKINVRTGSWGDFAVAGCAGSDPISLYAYINNTNQGKAAAELARTLGISEPAKSKGPKIYTDLLWPCPADAPAPPTERNVKTPTGWEKYPIKFRWPYYNQTGSLLGYVVRYETIAGKETPPITLWRTSEGQVCWRYKSFPDPRPLFNLEKLARSPAATVIIVEGEKCVETLQGIIESAGAQDRLCAITWPGGGKSILKADWSSLRGRKAVLWPDFDLQVYPDNHPSAGQVMPYHEQPGMVAMVTIAGILRGLEAGAQLKLIQQQPDHPGGWDVADAILQDGWNLPKILEFIRAHAVVSEVRAIKSKTKPVPASVPAEGASLPFKPLGYRAGYCYYLPLATLQVTAIKSEMHGAGALMTLAPLSYWERTYSGSTGPQWKLAADTCIRLCERAGIYDPMRQRGRGGWYDEGRAILHLGNRLIVDGKPMGLDKIKSDFIYEAGRPIEHNIVDPLSVQEAHRLREITDMLFWSQKIYGVYIAGWCFIATICGCLKFRPHIWITGAAATGKSHVVENIIDPILGAFHLPILHDSSAAGIRQELGCDALPIRCDEFEAENPEAQFRQKDVIELARAAYSDTRARILKGSQSGKAVSYSIRSTFCFSSIGVNIDQHADITRILTLSLDRPHDTPGQTAGEHFKKLKKLTAEILTPDWCAGFRARAVKMIPIVRQNAEIFALVITDKLKSRRIGDQVGALLAGAWALSSDGLVSIESAREWVDKQNWSEQCDIIDNTDEQKLLTTLMSEIIFVGHDRRTIGEVIESIKNQNDAPFDDSITSGNSIESESAALCRVGIKYEIDDALVFFGAYHPGLHRILERTPWKKTYARILKRIPDIIERQMRFHGNPLPAIGIPLNKIFG